MTDLEIRNPALFRELVRKLMRERMRVKGWSEKDIQEVVGE